MGELLIVSVEHQFYEVWLRGPATTFTEPLSRPHRGKRAYSGIIYPRTGLANGFGLQLKRPGHRANLHSEVSPNKLPDERYARAPSIKTGQGQLTGH